MRTKVFFLATALVASISAGFADNYPEAMYVIGDATPAEWNSDNVIRMENVSEGVFEYTADFNEGRFRFVTTYDFAPGYGPKNATTVVSDNENETYLELATGDYELEYRQGYTDPDKSFKVTTAGRYKCRVDLTGTTPKVTISDGTGLADQYAEHPVAIYAIGDATTAGWTIENAIELAETSWNSGIYKATLKLAPQKELKFMQTRKWNNHMYVSTQSGTTINAEGDFEVKYTTSGDEDWKWVFNLEEKNYDLTVDLNTMKLTIATPEIVKPEQLYLVGPAIGGENDWSFHDDQIFVKTDDGIYTWTGDLKQGELKFFADKDYSAVAYGATSDKTPLQEGDLDVMLLGDGTDYKFNVTSEQAGNHTLTLNLNTMKLNVVRNGGTTTNLSINENLDWKIDGNRISCTGADRIEVLAINGMCINSCNNDQLDISNLHKGMYIAILHKNNQKSIHKFIVH